jgi:hypothetical protein
VTRLGELVDIVLGVISLIGLAAFVLWLIGLPAGEDEEELAGLISRNWAHIEPWTDDHRDWAG